jgi:hypothetical protein
MIAYATDANTRLLTAVLGSSLQTNSAQRRREFGKLVMDMFVNDNNCVREHRRCASEEHVYFCLSTALRPRVFSVHIRLTARHRRAAVLVIQARFLSVVLLTSCCASAAAFMSRKRFFFWYAPSEGKNYYMPQTKRRSTWGIEPTQVYTRDWALVFTRGKARAIKRIFHSGQCLCTIYTPAQLLHGVDPVPEG